MIQRGFDIDAFAKKIKADSERVFPPELPSSLRDFIGNLIFNYIIIAGQELAKDKTFYSKEQALIICQVVAEWMYHKGIDMYKSQIPEEYWTKMSQKMAFVVFETAKQQILANKEQDAVISAVEDAVDNSYKDLVEQLWSEGKLVKSPEEIYAQSDLHDYIDETNSENDLEYIFQDDNIEILNNNFAQTDAIEDAQNNRFNIPTINDSQVLKAKILDMYAASRAFKYFLRAGKVLKKSGFNKTTRQQILYYLSCCVKDTLSFVSVEAFEWKHKDIDRILLSSMEILLDKIIILRGADIPIDNFTTIIDMTTRIVYAVELQYIKDKNKLSETFHYTRMAVEQECNKKIQELVDKKIITREQLYAAKSKSHLLYLDKDIKKFDGISRIFNAKTLIIVVILFAVLRLFFRYVVMLNVH